MRRIHFGAMRFPKRLPARASLAGEPLQGGGGPGHLPRFSLIPYRVETEPAKKRKSHNGHFEQRRRSANKHIARSRRG